MSDLKGLPGSLFVVLGVLGAVTSSYGESRGQLLDPTRPKGWQASEQIPAQPDTQSVENLKLQGTFSLAGERSAMISGKRVMVGDQVSGALVLEIKRDTVLLRIAGETVELASLLPEVKSAANSKGDFK